jgi:4-amino-4-deoxy-L-arabinose transferase
MEQIVQDTPQTTAKKNNLLLFLIFCVWVMGYLIPSFDRPLFSPDETRYIEVSREILSTGNWVMPQLFELKYFEKPILSYWLQALSMKLFGEHAFAGRLPTTLAALGSALLLFYLTLQMTACRQRSITAALIYLSMLQVVLLGSFLILDTLLTFFVLAALCSAYKGLSATQAVTKKRAYSLMGLAMGLGFLCKGFIALVLSGLVIGAWLFLYKAWKDVLHYGLWFLICFMAATLPWAVAVHQQAPDFWHHFLFEQNIGRMTGTNTKHHEPFWFYLPVILFSTLPWSLFVGPLVRFQKQQSQHSQLLLWSWFLLPLIFLSCSTSKLWTYVLPLCAPLAIIFALGFHDLLAQKSKQSIQTSACLLGGIACLILGAFLVLQMEVTSWQALYNKQEPMKALGFAGMVGIWLWVAYRLWKQPQHFTLMKIASFPIVFMLLAPKLLPERTLSVKAAVDFAQSSKQWIDAETEIIVEDFNIASSLAWSLKRTNFVFFGLSGNELSYGLRQPESNHRAIEKLAHLRAHILEQQKERTVALFMKSKTMPEAGIFPKPTHVQQDTPYLVYIYHKLNH